MKAVIELPEDAIPDVVVRRSIEYLDSPTDYREFVPREQQPEIYSRCGWHNGPNDVDEFLLVFVPILLVAIAIVTVFWR